MDMGRDVLGWLGRRLFEALAVALALWVVSLRSGSIHFADYFDSAWGIGASAGLGWGIRTLSPSGYEGWISGILRPLGILMIFLALFAAILEMGRLPGFLCY
jgi:hypothetical protein